MKIAPLFLLLHPVWRHFGPYLVRFWLWMLIDAITSSSLNGTEKLIWVLVIFFIPCLGAILYFFVGRRRRLI